MLWAYQVLPGGQLHEVEAERAAPSHEYQCPNPECANKRVVPRALKSEAVKPHFMHPGARCAWGHGETREHRSAKRDFRDAFRRRGFEARAEVPLDCLTGPDRRADVLVKLSSELIVALEVQHSPISLEQISAKTIAYAGIDVPVLWLPLVPRSFRERRSEWKKRPSGGWILEKFAAPHWHRWIKAYQFGRLYYYYDEAGKRILECGFDPYECFEEGRDYWNPNSEEWDSSRGGPYRSKKWVSVYIRRNIPLDSVALNIQYRDQFTAGLYNLPKGRLVQVERILTPAISHPFPGTAPMPTMR